ncbi:hypothetical protein WKH56_08200 [Priestia sp. SB1]|uniref:hypothetical protein n=1 Tax=Priestia sp. SB1 TaxID=3132359 RepID=UPI003180D960
MKKEKTFVYEGLVFEPYKLLQGEEATLFNINQRRVHSGLTPVNWDSETFFQAAQVVNGKEYDLFKVKGIVVLPGKTSLYEYK